MRKFGLLGTSALGSFAMFSMAMATPAYAQDAQTDDAAAADDATQGDDEIVVTGSRIRRPNLESQVPVTSISGESFFQQSNTNIGDTLNELPQLRSTFAQSNPGLGIGIAGLNLLDLRGLGTVRTLTLVNGRRHVGADILNNASSPDVNTIPNDLVERVDILTGGSSALYGSDAIAGVVNFILKRDFEGVQIRGSAAVSEKGFGGNQYVSGMFGHNFADGRGNVTVHAEFANTERVFGSDIPWLRRQDGLLVVDVDPAGLAEGSDGFPDRAYFRDVRTASIHRFGLIPITQDSAAAANPLCGRGIGTTNGAPGTTGGTAYNCTYIFTQDGQLIQQTGTRLGQGIIGGIVGGNGQTGREAQLLSVLPGMQRYNFNLLAHFNISEALEPFIEAKFVRVDARGSNAGPSFIQGQQTQFDFRERTRLDNPFLDPSERTTIANAILASGCRPSLTATCNSTAATTNRLTAADIAAINAGTFRFVTARHLSDSGIRDEEFRRDTYRIVGGLRGNFNDDWNYELSVNYGKMKEDTTTYGYLDRQRFMLAMDAGRDPLTNQIRCRSQFDATAAVPFGTDPFNAARLAADIAACVPYNPFGGTDNSASANYFVYNARHKASMSQFDVMGFMAGDTSQLFEMPGGPVRFALGAEYRKEKANYTQDPFVENGYTNAVAIPTFTPPAFEVSEAFVEVQVPVLKDTPFFQDLTVSGAARVSDYGGAIGTVWAYNAGLEWSPIRDLRFRGNYSRSVRAPNLSETAFPIVPNFAPGFLDPCASGNIAGNPNRAANCLADLGATLLAGLPNVTYSLPILSGSNPDLKSEKSDSWTVGAVIQPRFLPGFSLSIDWYKITVNNVIVSLTAQAIANGCYDAPTLDNPFCGLFTRWAGPGPDPQGAQPGQIASNSLLSAGQNFAKRIRKGIDIEAAYRKDMGSIKLDTRLIYTHSFQISNYQDPSFPEVENRILGELGDPKDEFRWDVALTHGPVTLGYQMSYIGPMVTNLYEDFYKLEGACNPVTGACPPFNSDWADIRKFPAVVYHDIRVDYELKNLGGFGKDFMFYAGIDNFTNKKPPLGSTATGAGSAIYNVLGRRYFAGFRARF